MATAVAAPASPDAETPPQPDGADPTGPEPASSQAAERTCAKCGKPLQPDQDWCLSCGTAAPGALDSGGPTWRTAALILGATAILVLAAAAAAYAALTEPSKPGEVKQLVVAVTPTTTTPTAPPAAAAPPATTTTPTPKPAPPVTASKPPKIPLTSTTVAPAKTTPAVKTPSASKETSTSQGGKGTSTTPSQPAILLDTNAASTYNPDSLPESSFGDPSLAIDGDNTTGWTALVEPSTAPNMAAGLTIDLKDTQRVASVELITPTPGITVQIYGSSAASVPAAITSPEWTALSKAEVLKTKHVRIDLSHTATAFRFITVWISKAPASAVGTPQAPGRVALNEVELFAGKGTTPAKAPTTAQ